MNADRGTDPSFVEVLISDPDLRLNPTVEWSPHARDRWGERAGAVGYLRAWAQSEEVDYPSAHSATRGRYHEATDTVLVVKRLRRNGGAVGWEFVDIVVSVIELGDRPRRRAAPRPPGTRHMSRQMVAPDRCTLYHNLYGVGVLCTT